MNRRDSYASLLLQVSFNKIKRTCNLKGPFCRIHKTSKANFNIVLKIQYFLNNLVNAENVKN